MITKKIGHDLSNQKDLDLFFCDNSSTMHAIDHRDPHDSCL